MDVFLVYAGFLSLLIGFANVLKPLRFLRIRTRTMGGLILALGSVLVLSGILLPAPLIHTSRMQTHLDYFMPAYQFHEVHSAVVRATPDRVFQAVKGVTPEEIRFFRTLTWIRSPRLASDRETILHAPPSKPILETATGSEFLLLVEEINRELVIGTVLGPPLKIENPTPEDFLLFEQPCYSKVAMNFHIEDAGAGLCRVTTETRIYSTDSSARWRFAVYWRVIYPGSAVIRRMWLQAIKRRAEGGS